MTFPRRDRGADKDVPDFLLNWLAFHDAACNVMKSARCCSIDNLPTQPLQINRFSKTGKTMEGIIIGTVQS